MEQLAWKVIKGARPELVKHGPLRLSLAWVTDKEIRKVNALYRGKNEATDVLSFSFVERNRPAQDGCLGELLISTETLKRQAKEQKLVCSSRPMFYWSMAYCIFLGMIAGAPATCRHAQT